MTGLLPKLRWLLAAATTALRPPVAPKPSRETTERPAWRHEPPAPRERAKKCGHPECDNPVGDFADGEFCGPPCASRWLAAERQKLPSRLNTDLFIPPDISPQPPPEPAWMANLTAWEKARAAALIAARKSPTGEEKAA